MSVASGINALWTGTHAGVPSGWSRNTSLDDKYVLGAGAGQDGGGTGGQATHTHTVVDHTHQIGSHSHTLFGFTAVGTSAIDEFAGGSAPFDFDGHNHSGAASLSTQAAFNSNNNASSVSMDAQSNDPPYVTVIFIESGGTPDGIPDEATVLWEDTGLPSGWAENDGGGSRTDLRDKFLKGAATSADAGGTGGSSNSHTHTEDGTKHTHTVPDHNHGGAALSTRSDAAGHTASSSISGAMSYRTHKHNVSIANNSPSMTLINVVNTTKISSQSGDAQPPFTKLRAIENGNGSDDLPDGVVCLWFGTRASIPLGWVELDGAATNEDMRGQFLKCASGEAQIGTTGGADQHTHTANSHTHDLNNGSHTHSGTGGDADTFQSSDVIVESNQASTKGHTHTWFITSTNPSLSGTVVTINNSTSQTNYPPYVKGIFVKFDSALLVQDTRAVHKMHIGLGFGPGFRR